MIYPQDCIRKYGQPTPEFERSWMKVITIPADIHQIITPLPLKIYMNKDLFQPFLNALLLVDFRNLQNEIEEWDGCFAIRKQRGAAVPSIHSWGIAFDINVSTNQLGQPPSLSPELVSCFKECGFDWGGDFHRLDGMHFQLSKI